MALQQARSLPYSIRYDGYGYRYHSRSHFYLGQDFYKTFEDGPWKWEAQERYSPAEFVCGHYLSCDRQGAKAEARFYSLNKAERDLLELRIEGLDNILDLTWEEHFKVVFGEILETPPNHFLHMLRMLSHSDEGGNKMTDEVGWWAQSKGYSGIKYFGARAIERYRAEFTGTGDRQAGLYIADEIFDELRQNPSTHNLVVFVGSKLIRHISAYRFRAKSIGWKKNQYYGFCSSSLDSLFRYGVEYRRERLESIYELNVKPWVDINWDGKVRELNTLDNE